MGFLTGTSSLPVARLSMSETSIVVRDILDVGVVSSQTGSGAASHS
jgi:hypothetical protein